MSTNIGRSGHLVETAAISRELVGWLEAESNGAGWVAVVVLSNGDLHRRRSPEIAGVERPSPELIDLAERLCIAVNRHAANEGAWVVAICGTRVIKAFWKDPEGIVRVIAEEDQPWARIKDVSIDRWVANCDVCVRKYVFQSLREMGIKPQGATSFLDLSSTGVGRS